MCLVSIVGHPPVIHDIVWIKPLSSEWYYQHWNVPEQYRIVNSSQLLKIHVLFACYLADMAAFQLIIIDTCAVISVSVLELTLISGLCLGVAWRQRVLYLLICVSIQAAWHWLAYLSIEIGNMGKQLPWLSHKVIKSMYQPFGRSLI